MRRLAVLIVPFVLAAVAVVVAPPASAHGAEAALSVVSARDEGNGMRYIVRVVYQNDGEPVPNATLTAVAIGPDSAEATPVAFSKTETIGEYMGFVALDPSGPSSVRFAVAQPEGGLTITDQQVVSTTVAAPTTIVAPTTAAPTTVAAGTTVATATTVQTAEDSEGSSGAPVVGAALAAAVVMGIVVTTARRRRDRAR